MSGIRGLSKFEALEADVGDFGNFVFVSQSVTVSQGLSLVTIIHSKSKKVRGFSFSVSKDLRKSAQIRMTKFCDKLVYLCLLVVLCWPVSWVVSSSHALNRVYPPQCHMWQRFLWRWYYRYR